MTLRNAFEGMAVESKQQIDALTNTQLRAAALNVEVADDLVTGTSAVTSGASTIVLTPTAGKAIRLKWVHLATSENNTAETIATVKLGGVVMYQTPLGVPGIFAHKAVRVGGLNQTLVVESSVSAQAIYVNVDYEEFQP